MIASQQELASHFMQRSMYLLNLQCAARPLSTCGVEDTDFGHRTGWRQDAKGTGRELTTDLKAKKSIAKLNFSGQSHNIPAISYNQLALLPESPVLASPVQAVLYQQYHSVSLQVEGLPQLHALVANCGSHHYPDFPGDMGHVLVAWRCRLQPG